MRVFIFAILFLLPSLTFAQAEVDLQISSDMLAQFKHFNELNFSKSSRAQVVAIEQQKADALTSIARTYRDNPNSNPPLFAPLTVDEQKVYSNPFAEIPAARR